MPSNTMQSRLGSTIHNHLNTHIQYPAPNINTTLAPPLSHQLHQPTARMHASPNRPAATPFPPSTTPPQNPAPNPSLNPTFSCHAICQTLQHPHTQIQTKSCPFIQPTHIEDKAILHSWAHLWAMGTCPPKTHRPSQQQSSQPAHQPIYMRPNPLHPLQIQAKHHMLIPSTLTQHSSAHPHAHVFNLRPALSDVHMRVKQITGTQGLNAAVNMVIHNPVWWLK